MDTIIYFVSSIGLFIICIVVSIIYHTIKDSLIWNNIREHVYYVISEDKKIINKFMNSQHITLSEAEREIYNDAFKDFIEWMKKAFWENKFLDDYKEEKRRFKFSDDFYMFYLSIFLFTIYDDKSCYKEYELRQDTKITDYGIGLLKIYLATLIYRLDKKYATGISSYTIESIKEQIKNRDIRGKYLD